jgi:serine/threonine-protein kinase
MARLSAIFLPPPAGEVMSKERIAALASMRAVWVGLALGLDLSLYALLRHGPGLRLEVVRLFGECNITLMVVDLLLTVTLTRRPWRGYRAVLTTCVVSETLAATVWIQMTGSVSSYFLIVGFLLILLYRLLVDYSSGLTCAVAMASMHTTAFVLENAGVLRPVSLFLSPPMGIYEQPLFRMAAMLSLLTGYTITFLALNFFASTLRHKEAALRTAQLDLARAVDETQRHHGRLSGQVIAGYELTELIGRGGMGEVYHGRSVDAETQVAVKVLHIHLIDEHEIRERFRREALLVARIPGSHVPRVLECGTTAEGQQFIVMEYLRGEDLAAVLRRRRQLPLDELVHLVGKIAVSLEAAHAVGVVHRDLKPQNVFLLDGSHDVRLLDFGIARLQEGDGLTLTTELLGTAGYMAPEQARGGTDEIGPHTDVFALGSIVYRALTGKCAFPSRSTAAAVYEALHLIPPPPSSLVSGLPEDIDDVVALALAKRIGDRYARPTQLACDLAAAAQGALDEPARERAHRLALPEVSQTRRIIHPALH